MQLTDINTLVPLNLWPQHRILIDFFKPTNAAPLCRALQGLDDEALEITLKLWAMDAQRELTTN